MNKIMKTSRDEYDDTGEDEDNVNDD